MPRFVPAAELSRGFYEDVLAPALTGVPHGAGLLGPGSDVLGLDDERSTDHDWGPRASVFAVEEDLAAVRARVEATVPETYRGWPTRIGRDGTPLEHHVTVDVWAEWVDAQLGVDASDMSTVDWLLVPQPRLLGVTVGPVFADPHGELADVRRRLRWYPDDAWWWLMASQWRRLAQEEPFVQRTAEVGDDLGSALVTARLVRDAVRLALLMARRYAPYAKWLGSAFADLDHHDGLDRQLAAAVAAGDLGRREAALAGAYSSLARRHARLPGASELDPAVRPFHDRPAKVLDADRFAQDCLDRVGDAGLRALPLIGAVDQVTDSTDLLTTDLVGRLRRLYEPRGSMQP